ncbi:MAG: hypothetical protein QOJ21_3642 [Solirubrobacteraceae bacterium]|jgi:DNA-binding transcriptional LysR family regulator|nr:hypothetical protein [Solirubrobacteraceae bacterium]
MAWNPAYVTRDPLAIRGLVVAGLAVTMTPRVLASQLPGVRTLRLTGDVPLRRLYALTPKIGSVASARTFVDALGVAARERTR